MVFEEFHGLRRTASAQERFGPEKSSDRNKRRSCRKAPLSGLYDRVERCGLLSVREEAIIIVPGQAGRPVGIPIGRDTSSARWLAPTCAYKYNVEVFSSGRHTYTGPEQRTANTVAWLTADRIVIKKRRLGPCDRRQVSIHALVSRHDRPMTGQEL